MSGQKIITTLNQFGDGQKQEIGRDLGQFLSGLCFCAPQLIPHLHSGGTVEIKTMSGMHLKLGFGAQQGGITTPGGITPVDPGKRFGA